MASKKLGVVLINKYDIVGKRFGKLYVVKYGLNFYDHTTGGDRMRHSYLCKCECGNMAVVRRQCLLNGYTKSCGCLRKGKRKYGN